MSADTVVMARRQATGIAAAGWALGALVVAVALSFVTNILFSDVLDAAIDPITGGGVVPEWIEAIGGGLIVGGAVGLVIGSRVGRGAVALAGFVTFLYLALWPFGTLFWSAGPMVASLFAHLLAAMATARALQHRARH
ncbi:MAG TPA: hypothetical protein VG318_11310 [Actinomycetota bacterium]|nr:hypothetical protein [Actinomycetota bacterium]